MHCPFTHTSTYYLLGVDVFLRLPLPLGMSGLSHSYIILENTREQLQSQARWL